MEAGAQGEHKLARGYLPTKTYSAHYIADPALRRAIADYLERERAYVDAAGEELAEYAPFRKVAPGSGLTHRAACAMQLAETQRQLPDADEIQRPAGQQRQQQRRGDQPVASARCGARQVGPSMRLRLGAKAACACNADDTTNLPSMLLCSFARAT